MKTKSGNTVPENKLKIIGNLKELIGKSKTILIASIKSLPASQYQEIVKRLRGKAIVKFPKKNLLFRAIETSDKNELKELEKHFDDSMALLFSDMESYELAGELIRSKSAAKAKPGQIAPYDIEIKAGMTELVPGPAISELSAVGIITKVTQGKLEITQDKVIVAEGKTILQKHADIMSKLDIKPFSIGFTPVCAFDVESKKLYCDMKIDRDKAVADLKEAFSRALPFAVSIGYVNKDTIGFLLSKAEAHALKINRIMTGEPIAVAVEAPKEVKEVKVEKKAPAAAGLGALFG